MMQLLAAAAAATTTPMAAKGPQGPLAGTFLDAGRHSPAASSGGTHAGRSAPKAKLVLLQRMNNVLKELDSDDPTANRATYADPSLPVDPRLVDEIAMFVKR